MILVLDTCAILWCVADPARLSDHAIELLTLDTTRVVVSPISAAEIACGVKRKRISLDRHWKTWFRHYIHENGWDVIPIDLEIIEESYSLPDEFHDDPADRIIVATARKLSGTVITGDRKILEYPHVEAVI